MDVLVGEASMVNDDTSDNCFYESIGRFLVIEEDEEPIHLLASDYKKFIWQMNSDKIIIAERSLYTI